MSDRKNLIRIVVAVVLVVAAVALYRSPLREYLTVERLRGIATSIASVWYGPLIYIAAYASASVFLIPASLFVIASGVIWGWKIGGIYAVIGGTLGAWASYHVARFVGGGVLTRFGPRAEAVAAQIKRAGFRSLLMFRLIPFPFPLVNYAAGATNVQATPFVTSTFVGLIPSAFLFAYIGDVVRFAYDAGTHLDQHELITKMSIRLLTIGVCVAAVIVIPSLLKRRAERALRADEMP